MRQLIRLPAWLLIPASFQLYAKLQTSDFISNFFKLISLFSWKTKIDHLSRFFWGSLRLFQQKSHFSDRKNPKESHFEVTRIIYQRLQSPLPVGPDGFNLLFKILFHFHSTWCGRCRWAANEPQSSQTHRVVRKHLILPSDLFKMEKKTEHEYESLCLVMQVKPLFE